MLTLFGAAEWLLLDGHWLVAHPNQYTMQRQLFSFFGGDQNWDEISFLIIGAEISQAMIADNHTQLILNKARTQHVLELPENTSRLPLNGGTLKPKNWPKTESQLDAWVVTTSQLDVD